MNRYSAHAAFYAPAVPSAALWRVVIGFLAASAIYLLLNNLLFGAVFSALGAQSDVFYRDLLAGRTPFAMLLLLGSFGLMIAGVAVVTRIIHRRSFQLGIFQVGSAAAIFTPRGACSSHCGGNGFSRLRSATACSTISVSACLDGVACRLVCLGSLSA